MQTTKMKHQFSWHPCTEIKSPMTIFEVVGGNGSYLHFKNGKKLIDAISSWWCKSLGHQHPRLRLALKKQAEKLEHAIFANTTNDTIVQLSEKLCDLTKTLQKIFYASDGSSAVEIALKMSLHARKIAGSARHQFVSLKNSYHGETIGALSVSDVGRFKKTYEDLLFHCETIDPFYANQSDDFEDHWQRVLQKLTLLQDKLTAIIVEPIVQGAAGMKIYSPIFLTRLRAWTRAHDVHLIADEIMTGIGRTGKMLACEYANIEPDFLCLGKGLTGGWLPLSAVLTTNTIYELLVFQTEKPFLHSHTYSGNILAANVALETLNIIDETNLCERANLIGDLMRKYMQEIAYNTSQVKNVRQLGALVAADCVNEDIASAVSKKAINLGALLRPLGKTIYWLPPLNIEIDVLQELKCITQEAIVLACATCS